MYNKYSGIPISGTLIFSNLPTTPTKSHFPLLSPTMYSQTNQFFEPFFCFPKKFNKLAIPLT